MTELNRRTLLLGAAGASSLVSTEAPAKNVNLFGLFLRKPDTKPWGFHAGYDTPEDAVQAAIELDAKAGPFEMKVLTLGDQ